MGYAEQRMLPRISQWDILITMPVQGSIAPRQARGLPVDAIGVHFQPRRNTPSITPAKFTCEANPDQSGMTVGVFSWRPSSPSPLQAASAVSNGQWLSISVHCRPLLLIEISILHVLSRHGQPNLVSLDSYSLGLNWALLVLHSIPWFHSVSLGLTWSHLISLVSLGLTWFGVTWARLASVGLLWCH